MAKLILDNLNKSYGNFQALKNFSLTIEDGELIVIVGPSGCGKTTVLRIIAGLLKQDSGKIMLDSNDISDFEREAGIKLFANIPPINDKGDDFSALSMMLNKLEID